MFSSRVPARLRAVVAVGAVTALAAAGCSSSTSSKSAAKGDSPITIGLITALTGSNKALGPDHLNGFQLYLDTHGDKLGGHTVKLDVGDEANGGAAAVPVAKKMIAYYNPEEELFPELIAAVDACRSST